MTLAYFDCFAGVAGDMIVGALLDAGADLEALQNHLAGLKVGGYSTRVEKVNRGGLRGSKFHVEIDEHDHAHRHLQDILAIINGAALPPRVAQRARDIFHRLAQAEAKAHGVAVEEVHFHEVGAIDSIVDVVGACIALELLDVDRVICSPIPAGSGTARTAHGILPVPTPATAELLIGAKVSKDFFEGEVTTPTGAAVMVTLAESFGPLPPVTVQAVGYGAGTKEGGPVPNLLRVVLGQSDELGTTDSVVELSVNLDDCTGQILGATIEKLLEAGCLDAWATPAVMKKSRPAWQLSALCNPADAAVAEAILFAQTTTFGIRRHTLTRGKLQRRHETVETPYGPIRVKVGSSGGRVITATPEFADCLRAADSHHMPVKDVIAAAQRLFQQGRAE